ncbi:MAG: hypothetical protein AAGG44_05875 [Planctomycetota bacterium]
MRESLWLDELHTSWVVSADWSEVGFRSRAGNQSPSFMWLVKLLDWTLGTKELDSGTAADVVRDANSSGFLPRHGPNTEVLLRLPSWLAYGAVVFVSAWICLCRYRVPFSGGLLVFLATCVFLGLDRIQLFYATEARVYALLQLLSLLGWWCVDDLARQCREISLARNGSSAQPGALTPEIPSVRSRPVYLWTVLAVTMIYLHLIAGIVLLVQALVVVGVCCWFRQWRVLGRFAICAFVAASVAIPAGWLGLPVWERRNQWNRFAGDASFSSVSRQFPIVPILVPALVAKVVDWVGGWFGKMASRKQELSNQVLSSSNVVGRNGVGLRLWVWCIALTGPLLVGWALTTFEIAPVMHRRYLLASSVPLSLLAVSLLITVRFRWMSWIALAVSCGWLVTDQPTLEIWRSGQIQGALRGEDWRGAAEWISKRIENGDEIWCGSDLIEGDGLPLPLDEDMDRYLAFPLAGHYSIAVPETQSSEEAGEATILRVQPRALLSNAGMWLQQWFAPEMPAGERHLFVVARAPAEDLAAVMEAVVRQPLPPGMELVVVGAVERFGLLSGVRVRVARPEGSPPAS